MLGRFAQGNHRVSFTTETGGKCATEPFSDSSEVVEAFVRKPPLLESLSHSTFRYKYLTSIQ